MGDTSNLEVCVEIADPEVRQAVRKHLNNYVPIGTFVYMDDEDGGEGFRFGANEISVGTVDEVFDGFLGLIQTGVEEFECPVCKGSGENPSGPQQTSDGYWSGACQRCAGEGSFTLPVPDFAFAVNDEPKYEWMGTVRMHVPGLPDFTGECDADGVVRVSPNKLMKLLDEATDLELLRAEVAELTGRRHIEHLYGPVRY